METNDLESMETRDIYLINYESTIGTVKNKTTLKHNLLSFLLSGKKRVHYADRTVEIDNSRFMLLSSGNCLMSEKIAGEEGYQSVLLFFDNKILSDFFVRHPIILSKSSKNMNEVPCLVFEKDDFLRNFIQSLLLMIASVPTISRDLLKNKLEEFLLFMSSRYPSQIISLQNTVLEFDDLAVKKAVAANVTTNVTVEELAFLCHTSLSTFKRRFAKLYGTTPNKWLLQERMKFAANLLKKGHLTSEVYSQIGYENLSSFIHSFKQVYGVTPKQFQANQ